MKDFKNITFDVIDININVTPDIYINRNGITFSKRVLEDLNYPAYVQYCINGEQRVFAIRACKGTEAKSAPFSKPKTEQASTVSTSNKNISAAVRALMAENSDPTKRYKVVGYFDPDTRTIYYDMETAVEDAFRAPKE
jgi:hypothetical protein